MSDTAIPSSQRITLIMASTTLGGLENHVTDLAIGLSQRGFEVTLIADPRYQADFASTKVAFVGLDFSRSRRNPILLWQLYQAIVASGPDIVHVHANKAAQLVDTIKHWLPKQVSYLVTLHAIKHKQPYLDFFQTIICVSELVKANLEPKLQSRAVVILNGIHPLPASHQPPSKTVDIIAIGALRPVKGFDTLVEAVQDSASVWIVGEGEQREQLAQRINQLASPSIQLLGHRNDIATLLPQARLYVLSSEREGGSLTLAESLLSNVPVVATRVGMAPQILPAAYLVEPGNVAELREKIGWALANYAQVVQDYVPVFAWAKQHLTFDKMLDNTIEIYQRVGLLNI